MSRFDWRANGVIHAAGDLEVSESAAEGDLTLVIERLAAKDQHRVLLEGRANLGPRPLIERAGDNRRRRSAPRTPG